MKSGTLAQILGAAFIAGNLYTCDARVDHASQQAGPETVAQLAVADAYMDSAYAAQRAVHISEPLQPETRQWKAKRDSVLAQPVVQELHEERNRAIGYGVVGSLTGALIILAGMAANYHEDRDRIRGSGATYCGGLPRDPWQ